MSVLLRRVEHWHVGTREEGIWGHTGRRRLQLSWQRASGKGRLDLQTSMAYASSLVTAYWRGEHTLSRCVYTHFRTYKNGYDVEKTKMTWGPLSWYFLEWGWGARHDGGRGALPQTAGSKGFNLFSGSPCAHCGSHVTTCSVNSFLNCMSATYRWKNEQWEKFKGLPSR